MGKRQVTHPGQPWLLAGNISLNLPDDRPIVSSGEFTRANPEGKEPGVFLTFAGRQDGYFGSYWLHMSPATAKRVAQELLMHADHIAAYGDEHDQECPLCDPDPDEWEG